MRKSTGKISFSLIFLMSTAALWAQTSTPFEGKWVLNVSQSKFNPPPAPKNETVTNMNGKTTIEGVAGDGTAYKWSFAQENGKTVPIDGMEKSSVIETINGKTLNHTWKMGSGTSKGHGVLSKDGKTLKYTDKGTNPQGQPMDNLYVFEKQ